MAKCGALFEVRTGSLKNYSDDFLLQMVKALVLPYRRLVKHRTH